jgi:hypothetical protein
MAKVTLMCLKISCWPLFLCGTIMTSCATCTVELHNILRFLFVGGLTTNSRVGGLVIEGHTECPVHDLCWAQEASTNKNRENLMNWNNKFQIKFVAFPLKVLSKKYRVCVSKVALTCQECWNVCWDFTPNGVVLASKWCKNCRDFKPNGVKTVAIQNSVQKL